MGLFSRKSKTDQPAAEAQPTVVDVAVAPEDPGYTAAPETVQYRTELLDILSVRMGAIEGPLMRADFQSHMESTPGDPNGIELGYICMIHKLIEMIDLVNQKVTSGAYMGMVPDPDPTPPSPFAIYAKRVN